MLVLGGGGFPASGDGEPVFGNATVNPLGVRFMGRAAQRAERVDDGTRAVAGPMSSAIRFSQTGDARAGVARMKLIKSCNQFEKWIKLNR